MSNFNLPPGCSANSIPGNSNADAYYESLLEELASYGLTDTDAETLADSIMTREANAYNRGAIDAKQEIRIEKFDENEGVCGC